jgi:heme-degrading monooxygenase HmoA
MVLEHALLYVKHGEEEAFEDSMREALPIIESVDECFGAEVRRQAEDDSVYLLLVRWGSIEAHMAFRSTGPLRVVACTHPPLLPRDDQRHALLRTTRALARQPAR